MDKIIPLITAIITLLGDIATGKADPLPYVILGGYLLSYIVAYSLARVRSRRGDGNRGMQMDEAVYAAWAAAFVSHAIFSAACVAIWVATSGAGATASGPVADIGNRVAASYSIAGLFVAVDILLARLARKHRIAAREEWRVLIS